VSRPVWLNDGCAVQAQLEIRVADAWMYAPNILPVSE
jgi:hypothetical protein